MKNLDFIKSNYPLSNLSTIKIGGSARYFAEPNTFKEFLLAFEFCKKNKLPLYILGNGSNTLCSSSGYEGVVISTKNFNKKYDFQIKLRKNRNKIKCSLRKNIIHTALFDFTKKLNMNVRILKKKYLFVSAYCGYNLPKLSYEMCIRGYKGLEFATNIPASLGGAVKMNAGAFNGQMSDCVYRVLIYNCESSQIYYKWNSKIKNKINVFDYAKSLKFTTKSKKNDAHDIKINKSFDFNKILIKKRAYFNRFFCFTKNNCALDFSYRVSNILDTEFIISVDLILLSDKRKNIDISMKENIDKRRSTQNVGYPSLGSVFKKCGNIPPAKLIEDSGLKGLSIGGAMVSKVHSGYVVNYNNATSQDICKLLKIIRRIICKKYNIMLQYEIRFLGDIDEEN